MTESGDNEREQSGDDCVRSHVAYGMDDSLGHRLSQRSHITYGTDPFIDSLIDLIIDLIIDPSLAPLNNLLLTFSLTF